MIFSKIGNIVLYFFDVYNIVLFLFNRHNLLVIPYTFRAVHPPGLAKTENDLEVFTFFD